MAHPSSHDDAVRFRQADDLEEVPMGDRIALYRSDIDKAVVLNRVGSLLWQHLATPRTKHDLVEHLIAKFPAVERDRLETDVSSYLGELRSRGIILPPGEA